MSNPFDDTAEAFQPTPPKKAPVQPATAPLDETLRDMGRERTPEKNLGLQREKWGLFPDISFADYMLDPAPEPSISNSGIGLLMAETPFDFAFDHPRLPPLDAKKANDNTAAKIAGSIVHRLALGKGADYAVAPFNDFKSQAARDFRDAAIAEGRCPIAEPKFAECEVMAAIIKERIKIALDGADYETEVVFLYQEETPFGPVWVRGCIDVWCAEKATILDPKVTPRIYNGMVERQFINMGWDRQAALYPHAIGKIIPELAGRVDFADLLVKPKPPYTSRRVAPEKGWKALKLRTEATKAFETFAYCLKEGRWPSFPLDETELLSMPAWEEARLMADEEGEE